MVRMRYNGFVNHDAARKAFEGLKPFRNHVIQVSLCHFPQSPDWKALHRIVESIDDAARHFGQDVMALYASTDGAGGGQRRRLDEGSGHG